jgi:hypothetical protein
LGADCNFTYEKTGRAEVRGPYGMGAGFTERQPEVDQDEVPVCQLPGATTECIWLAGQNVARTSRADYCGIEEVSSRYLFLTLRA